eukprot:3014727-Pyramimonas_sp.AAC.1
MKTPQKVAIDAKPYLTNAGVEVYSDELLQAPQKCVRTGCPSALAKAENNDEFNCKMWGNCSFEWKMVGQNDRKEVLWGRRSLARVPCLFSMGSLVPERVVGLGRPPQRTSCAVFELGCFDGSFYIGSVSYTHLRAHETGAYL